jgi:uncharacterized protein (DUF2249 family)
LTGIKVVPRTGAHASPTMTDQLLTLDVREDLRSGRAPCSQIMALANRIAVGGTFRLIAPFEPVPLYDVLRQQGFAHEALDLGGGDWEVRFTRDPKAAAAQALPADGRGQTAECGCGCSSASQEGSILELDVRGLEPPQPMTRVLESLASLSEGVTLRALTDRRPIHLLDQLEARGFRGECEEHPEGGCITVIRRC